MKNVDDTGVLSVLPRMNGSMEISLPKALMAGTQFKRTMKRK